MSILYTFPGQGAQKPGMLHALPDHPEVARTLDEARAVLGAEPLALDTAQALASTVAVQLCLLIAGVAMARVLAALGARPDMVAGLSIGAYPAAVCAGALDFRQAVRLVSLRARLMEEAYPEGYGMAAIIGLDRYQLEPLIDRVHRPETPVYLANLNAQKQLVIAGEDGALASVTQLAIGAGAARAERIDVTVPSHCALFDATAATMSAAFRDVVVRRPVITYISSNAARVLTEPARIADDLANNMARQVCWYETARLAWERGARLALEMPSGVVLTGLTAPVFDGGLSLACENNRIDTLLALIERERQLGG